MGNYQPNYTHDVIKVVHNEREYRDLMSTLINKMTDALMPRKVR